MEGPQSEIADSPVVEPPHTEHHGAVDNTYYTTHMHSLTDLLCPVSVHELFVLRCVQYIMCFLFLPIAIFLPLTTPLYTTGAVKFLCVTN